MFHVQKFHFLLLRVHCLLNYVSLLQNHAMLVLELKNLQKKLDEEAAAHRKDLDSLTADKKRLLSSTEEANLEALQGLYSLVSIIYIKIF